MPIFGGRANFRAISCHGKKFFGKEQNLEKTFLKLVDEHVINEPANDNALSFVVFEIKSVFKFQSVRYVLQISE